MKVCISVPGRFHGFDLARELQKQDCLHCLVTSYPSYKATKFGIKRSLVRTIVSKEIVVRGYHKLFNRYPNWFWLSEWFDRSASWMLPMDGDVYVLWAGFSLHSIRRIRRKNPKARIILERGSAHIEEQQRLLSLVGQNESVLPQVVQKERAEYKESDIISVPGKFVASSFLARNVMIEKIFVNPYGVDLKVFTGNHLRKDHSIFTIGYVGSISKQKNVEGIIEAVKILLSNGYLVRLILAGEIDTDSYTTDYLSQFNFVAYEGRLPQNRLPDIYKQMDVFVLNSIQDGFGMVLLQAMAMGVVPIASVNSGGKDVIDDGINGFLIPILDNNLLAERIKYLIENPDKRIEMGQLAERRVAGGFSWQDYGVRAVEFYRSLL